MNWLGWFLVVYFAVNAAIFATKVGTVRTGREIVWGVLESLALILVIVIWWPR